jgi:hypothetical protein
MTPGDGKQDPVAAHPAAVGKPQIMPVPHGALVLHGPPPPPDPLALPLLLPELVPPLDPAPLELVPLPELAPPLVLPPAPLVLEPPAPLLVLPAPLLLAPLPPSPPPSRPFEMEVAPPQLAMAMAKATTPTLSTIPIELIKASDPSGGYRSAATDRT